MRSPITSPRLRVLLAAGTAGLLVVLPNACAGEDVVAPAAVSGHWQLVSIDGEPVDGNDALAADGAIAKIDSAEIMFRRYGRMQDIRHLWRQGLLGPPLYRSDTMIVTYMVRRDSIFIRREHYVSSETHVDTGVIDGTAMEIVVRRTDTTSGWAYPRWRYTRIGETP